MKEVCLLDGGTGQEIYKRTHMAAHPLWCAKVMMDRPEIVKAVHQDFIKAGAKVITINSYTCTPTRLRRDGRIEWFEQLQLQAAEIALTAKRELGESAEKTQIAGCLPPLIGSYTTDNRSFSELKAEYEQIITLQHPYVDLFLIETISCIKEAEAAIEAALACAKPICISFTLSDQQPDQLRSGESITEAAAAMAKYKLNGMMFNCSLPETISNGIKAVKHLDIPYGGYANGFVSVEPLKPGGTVDTLSAREDMAEEKYADYVINWIEDGASIIGGCCEVSPSHINYLRKQLDAKGYNIGGLS